MLDPRASRIDWVWWPTDNVYRLLIGRDGTGVLLPCPLIYFVTFDFPFEILLRGYPIAVVVLFEELEFCLLYELAGVSFAPT